MFTYDELPRHVRRVAKKLAKQLLHSTATATEPPNPEKYSLVGAFATTYCKPERLEAVLIYSDDNHNYWGDVVFRKKNGICFQLGTPTDSPVKSYDEALKTAQAVIATSKLSWEHPLVSEFRKSNLDPEEITLLQIDTEKSGLRYAVLADYDLARGVDEFREIIGSSLSTETLLLEAQAILFNFANAHADDNNPMLLINFYKRERSAAQFLLHHHVSLITETSTMKNAA